MRDGSRRRDKEETKRYWFAGSQKLFQYLRSQLNSKHYTADMDEKDKFYFFTYRNYVAE